MKTPAFPAAMILIASLLTGCVEDGGEPMETVPYVDLEKFMGNWYVVANIPTSIELTLRSLGTVFDASA